MHAISKSVLKTKMLEYFRKVEKTKEPLVVTDHNKPVLKIIPYEQHKRPEEVFAGYRNKVIYYEDMNTPTTDEWSEI